MDEESPTQAQIDELFAPTIKLLYEQDFERVVGTRASMDDYQDKVVVGRTGFFDKITLGASGTAAAIVTFLGNNNHHLEPRWLLRTTILSLGALAIAALLRNLLAPAHRLHARKLEWMQASCEFSARRVTLSKNKVFRSAFVDGLLRDCMRRWPPSDGDTSPLLDSQKRVVKSSYNRWKAVERVSYVLIAFVLVCLAFLVWSNF